MSGLRSRATHAILMLAAGGIALSACTKDFGVFEDPYDAGAADATTMDAAADATDGMTADSALPKDSASPDGSTGDGSAPRDAGDGGDARVDSAGPTFTVGGTVTGLDPGDSVDLTDGVSQQSVSADGPFTFSTALPTGASFSVTVVGNPASPTPETCTVTNGSGTIGGSNVTSVEVTCVGSAACSPMCAIGQPCGAATDCVTVRCTAGLCAACTPACVDGAACAANTDCLSKTCTAGKCAPPACSPACGGGVACGANGDCSSMVCAAGRCALTSGTGSCTQNTDCCTKDCSGAMTCVLSPHTGPCCTTADCATGNCNTSSHKCN